MLALLRRALARAVPILLLAGTASAALQVELVKDICPASCDGVDNGGFQSYVVANGKLFFRSSHYTSNNLWATDGTAAGTIQLHDAFPGNFVGSQTPLTRVSERIYWGASPNSGGPRLFESDGTPAGTRAVPLSNDGTPNGHFPNAITDWNGEAWLERNGVIFRIASLGAPAQPMATLYVDATPDPMVPLGNALLAAGRTCSGCSGTTRIWRIGASGSLAAVDEIPQASVMSVHAGPGGAIVHVYRGPVLVSELWLLKADGSAVKIHESDGYYFVAEGMHGGRFWFSEEVNGRSQLFSTDGTAPGTRQETTLPTAGYQPYLFRLTSYQGQRYATARFGDFDGTFVRLDASHPQGAQQVRRVLAGVPWSEPLPVLYADRMFFSVQDGQFELPRLWASDGTPGGTQPVALPPVGGGADGVLHPIAELNGWLLLLRATPNQGIELWRLRGNSSDFPALMTQHVVEFYNPSRDHYFLTGKADEIGGLDSGYFPGWHRTGEGFTTYAPGANDPETEPVCRFYGLPSAGLDSHFYSSFSAECQDLHARFPWAWFLETWETFDVAQVRSDATCPTGYVPLYRTFNQRPDFNHRYTTDLAIQNQMVAAGWRKEGLGAGIAMCVLARDGGQ